MQRQFRLGGGVSPRGALLRGQSIIEYVLIIAVIGLVIVFAGPGVAGAIRNQFNLVGNTVNNGTTGGTEGGGASGGGSTGANSATVQAAIAKDAKDWALGEQKAVAEDIAAKGEASPAYAKAKAAMDAGTTWSVVIPGCRKMTYQIIGINHDDLADGTGKAGLTFFGKLPVRHVMNSTDTNAGGWEKSELRQKMNSGEDWNLLPSEFQSKVESVKKLTNNVGGGGDYKDAAVTATSDRLFLLSYSEIVPTSHWASDYPWTSSEGTQYEAFKGKVTENNGANSIIAFDYMWWERTCNPYSYEYFLVVNGHGYPADDYLGTSSWVNCGFCF